MEQLIVEDDGNIDKLSCTSVDRGESSTNIIKMNILEHLSTNENVFFKCVDEDKGELSKQEKIEIAQELLDRSCSLFLAKFGNYLLKEHLCYFENREDDESVIINVYLKQLYKKHSETNPNEIKQKCSNGESSVDKMELTCEVEPLESEQSKMRTKLLDHLSLSSEAYFRSQQVGDPDLLPQEKKDIASAILDKSASRFLARFGVHLLEEHLVYFDKIIDIDDAGGYEVKHHLKNLRKTHCKVVTPVGIKNRRFEALKKMVDEGNYFCETEMRNRNPLLYEQLVGKFLSPEERRDRLCNVDTSNITFVNLLLEQMDREKVKLFKKEQEDDEDNALEEEEVDSDVEMMDEYDSEEDNNLDKSLWGESYTDDSAPATSNKNKNPVKEQKKLKDKIKEQEIPEPSDTEKQLLLEEFRTNMFSSFLQGKDINFDYSKVDYNPDYDDLETEGQDAQEKYFDEESSENESLGKMSDDGDELEQYMSELRPEPTPQQLSERLKSLET